MGGEYKWKSMQDERGNTLDSHCVYMCVGATHSVVADDHAVEQRAHGVEAAHVQTCRSRKNAGW